MKGSETGASAILVGPLVGGWGATQDRDGLSGRLSVADGKTYSFPVEVTEAKCGVTLRRYEFHDEDGGAGRYRGGKGVPLEYEIPNDGWKCAGSFGRCKFPPWGVAGGQQGSPNYAEIPPAESAPARQKSTPSLRGWCLGKATSLVLSLQQVVAGAIRLDAIATP